ncbi:MAG TPA: dsDNA nuclease domain-containing protein [Thermoanaerobaculia bacterium]|nr:dsDNA nuclease domain-containing protein [Thermoanaerobaculia bacterium]
MAKADTGAKKPEAFPSVDEVGPSDESGPLARSGFGYQDEIAVGFLIEMLEDQALQKVHCETHDDVLLVWNGGQSAMRLAEFVQVKGSQPNKLWSVADLCIQEKSKAGSSILERSLTRDQHREDSLFRLVTLRSVASELKMLTFPRRGPGREVDGARFQALRMKIDKRFPNLKSPKGNGTPFWIDNCLWDVRHSEQNVRDSNLLRLIRLSGKEGRQLLPEQAEVLLDALRARAKAAGDAKWQPDRDQKIITREALRNWWERRTRELIDGAAAASGKKLREKMIEAQLPGELVGLALEMRRDYAAAVRTSRYMEPEEGDRLKSRVKSEVISLRARYAAGQLALNGAGFHALCLDRMDKINAERPAGSEDRSAFLKGCMYDIADRCLLRFASSGQ